MPLAEFEGVHSHLKSLKIKVYPDEHLQNIIHNKEQDSDKHNLELNGMNQKAAFNSITKRRQNAVNLTF